MLRKLMNLGFSFPLSSAYLFTFRGPAIYDKKTDFNNWWQTFNLSKVIKKGFHHIIHCLPLFEIQNGKIVLVLDFSSTNWVMKVTKVFEYSSCKSRQRIMILQVLIISNFLIIFRTPLLIFIGNEDPKFINFLSVIFSTFFSLFFGE